MRYFIFYYTYWKVSSRKVGQFVFKSNIFPSMKQLQESINEEDIILTGFNEFKSKEDYENFTR